jgi:hypothetical protein
MAPPAGASGLLNRTARNREAKTAQPGRALLRDALQRFTDLVGLCVFFCNVAGSDAVGHATCATAERG